jgi:branched-chain amino acid transport system permease protein
MEHSYLSQAVQFLFAGLSTGSIYALVALGFNIIYNVNLLVNLAQGEFVMFGALTMISLHSRGMSLVLAFPATILIVGMVGVLFDRFAIRPLKQPTIMMMILLTLGASTFFKGLALIIWGKDPYTAPPFSKTQSISILNATFSTQTLWVIATLIVVYLALLFFLEKTIVGKAMKACSENRRAASLMGINVKRFIMISFFLSGAIGAIGGMVVSPISFMVYDEGTMLGLKGFASAVLGGVGSYPGALVGGLVLGLLESFSTGYISSIFKDILAFLALLIILVLKPAGLLRRGENQ